MVFLWKRAISWFSHGNGNIHNGQPSDSIFSLCKPLQTVTFHGLQETHRVYWCHLQQSTCAPCQNVMGWECCNIGQIRPILPLSNPAVASTHGRFSNVICGIVRCHRALISNKVWLLDQVCICSKIARECRPRWISMEIRKTVDISTYCTFQ